MKKTVYTIGRDPSCDICLYDTGNAVSRHHAVLKIRKNGSYVIVDSSLNGTYVNGVRITPEKEVPVSRRDTIRFADSAELDWSLVPENPVKKRIAVIAGSVFLLIAAAVTVICVCPRGGGSPAGGSPAGSSVFFPEDSLSRRNASSGKDKPVFRRTLPKKQDDKEMQTETAPARTHGQDDSLHVRDTAGGDAALQDTAAVSDNVRADSLHLAEPASGGSSETEVADTSTINVNAIY